MSGLFDSNKENITLQLYTNYTYPRHDRIEYPEDVCKVPYKPYLLQCHIHKYHSSAYRKSSR